MSKRPPRITRKVAVTRRGYAGPPWRKRKARKALLLSEKEVCLRKLVWQERDKRSELEKELESCHRRVVKLRGALQRALEQNLDAATTDPYQISE